VQENYRKLPVIVRTWTIPINGSLLREAGAAEVVPEI